DAAGCRRCRSGAHPTARSRRRPRRPAGSSAFPGGHRPVLSRKRLVTLPARGESKPLMPREPARDMTDLVTAAKDGDREAFDELVRVTHADTYTLAYRLTGDEEDARDVVQEAYLRAYRGLDRFRGDAQF